MNIELRYDFSVVAIVIKIAILAVMYIYVKH